MDPDGGDDFSLGDDTFALGGDGFSLDVELDAAEQDVTAPVPHPSAVPDGEATVAEKDEEADKARLKEAFYRAKKRDEERLESVMAVDFYVLAVFNTPEDAQRFCEEAGVELDDESCVDGYRLAKRFGLSHQPTTPLPFPKVQAPDKWRKLALEKLGEPPEFTVEWDGKGKMPPFPLYVEPHHLRVLSLAREKGEALPPELQKPKPPKRKP